MASSDSPKLYLSPKTKAKGGTPKSPLFRRHHSEPAVDLSKLNLNEEEEEEDEKKQEEDAHAQQQAAGTVDLSSFSSDDALKFSEELKKAIDSIKSRKELPAAHIVSGVLDALEFWMREHGVKAINEVAAQREKYDALVLRSEKEKEMLSSMLDEYKKECQEYQSRRESLDSNKQELQSKLNEAQQQLENAHFLQQQIDELREELDGKHLELQKSLNTQIVQQKTINELKKEQIEFQQVIESQKNQLGKLKQMESELKSKATENKEVSRKHKENEKKLKRVSLEKEALFHEKKAMQTKLTDYGKLQDNLKQYKANEEHYVRTIDELKQHNVALLDQLQLLRRSQSPQSPISPKQDERATKQFVLERQTEMQPQEQPTTAFVQFVNETQSYNMSPPPFAKKQQKGRAEHTALAPLYDQHELEKMREEFDIAKQDASGSGTGNEGEHEAGDGARENERGIRYRKARRIGHWK
eukprot:CAMPEP_0197077242 /NCGR_PEP_ID=MMETSP1384-20130603/212519_1 /TAXON_ID=29189 /ORGANISM="Ammonia sp." /LENGTH=469 /DNA_ID=CAMNT_0042516103 /DNA_START=24 /DNA_END=1433 /DNA_ORIENTATION=+